jgi:NAD(P)-dependent dehydrogenase (short-subunit alcohol dehydrogenase family)
MTLDFENRVAIVTGAGNGLGRSHALALASRGAKVVVNDLGGDVHGAGASSSSAQELVTEILEAGGDAITHGADVCNATEVAEMVETALDRWNRVDILVNNAGVLRDRSFTNMSWAEFNIVTQVHLLGAFICTKAVWHQMRQQEYGRVVMTTSSSGLYGNFGQSNYGAAKMGLVGLMNTLCLEGSKYGINVNCLSPVASTRMTEELLSDDEKHQFSPESVTAGLLTLCDEQAPTRMILCAGAGCYSESMILETEGIALERHEINPECIRENLELIRSNSGQSRLTKAGDQTERFASKSKLTR